MVYRTRSNREQVYALKRMAVNNDKDLYLAKQEIAITVSLCLVGVLLQWFLHDLKDWEWCPVVWRRDAVLNSVVCLPGNWIVNGYSYLQLGAV